MRESWAVSIRQFLLLKNQFQLAIAAPRESIPDKRKRAKTMMAGISAGDCSIFRGEVVNRLEVESHEPFPVVGFGNFYKGDVYKNLGVEAPDASLCTTRPSDMKIGKPGQYKAEGKVEVRTYLGDSYQYEISLPFGNITAVSSSEPPFEVGSAVSVEADPVKTVILGE